MADFSKFFPTLLRFEGGYSDDPHDPGGATNKGVTFAVFKQYARTVLQVQPTLNSLKNLTDEQAGKIYKAEYWDKILGDEIEFQPLADIIFDFYVNSGSHAVVLLYKVLNSLGGHHEILPWLDSSAVRSMQHHDVQNIYMHYKEGRKAYYRQLTHDHPVLRRFLHGWLNRVDAFPNFGPTGANSGSTGGAAGSTNGAYDK